MRATHALFIRIPEALKSEDKKRKIDIEILKRQQDELRATLYEAGLNIVDLPLLEKPGKEKEHASSILIGDLVVVIKGVALLTRPKKEPNGERMNQLRKSLEELTWMVHDTPLQLAEKGGKVILEGGDVLFTGREIFVGVRKGATNIEGAMVVGRVFRDFPVITLFMNEKAHPLRYYLSMVNDKVIAVGTSKEAQSLLERVEREASFRYKRITVDDDTAVGCLNVNDRLLFRADIKDPKYNVLQGSGIELWGMDVTELAKAGAPFSRHCLLLDANIGRPGSSTHSTLTRSISKSVKMEQANGISPQPGPSSSNGHSSNGTHANGTNGNAMIETPSGIQIHSETNGTTTVTNGTTIVTHVSVHH